MLEVNDEQELMVNIRGHPCRACDILAKVVSSLFIILQHSPLKCSLLSAT